MSPPYRPLPELEPFEVARGAPALEVLEVGSGAGGIAEEPVGATALGRLAFVVVVARRALGRADHAESRAGQQQFHPCVLRLLGDLHLLVPAVDRVLDDRGD